MVNRGEPARATFDRLVGALRPGVTELFVHPAVDTPELRAATPDWAARVDDHALVTAPDGLRAALDAAGAKRIGYRALRDLQRAG